MPSAQVLRRTTALAFVVLSLAVGTTAAAAVGPEPRADLEVSIIHLNDFHARFEQILPSGGTCPKDDTSECIGGIARVITKVKEIQKENPGSLLLNAGDNFQGTLWFSEFGWNVTKHFLNMLDWTAITLGNHEFDRKVAYAAQFMEALNAPVVVANIDDSKEPVFQGKYQKRIVVEYGSTKKKIGIIGVITDTTSSISSPEKLEFWDVAETVKTEGEELKKEGVDIVVVLSHAGIEVDLEVAASDPNVDVIVGGHSHTLLHNGEPPNGVVQYDVYPITVAQDSGRKVAVVQAGDHTKYLGHLKALFDDDGELVSAKGNTIYMANDIVQDPDTVEAMKPWQNALEEISNTPVGNTAVLLEQSGGVCGAGECSLGNLVADAQVLSMVGKGPKDTWTRAAVAFTNSGGLRAAIAPGVITYADLIQALPFDNTIDYKEFQGKTIKAALEKAVSDTRRRGPRAGPWRKNYFGFLQVSGLRIVYDDEREFNDRAFSVGVLCHKCNVPLFEPLDEDEWYPVTLNSFLVNGGDGYVMFQDEGRNYEVGDKDTDVMKKYFDARDPITAFRDGRITFQNTTEVDCGSTGAAYLGRTPLSIVNILLVAVVASLKWL